ncbi:hypothetical protein BJY01DRAFT_259616 [Aspergillus pseudoustus]|uniref:Uncharacterized protein n=1 Tax=Aspergillus pseudoustus TaxID=1810923 RepID=A0ABR4J2E9_9EURO
MATDPASDKLSRKRVDSILDDLVKPGIQATPSNLSFAEPSKQNIAFFPVKDQWRHHGKYHITARFNLETTILDYNTNKRDGHELFFQDICLQYMNSSGDEEVTMEPQSDTTGAFTVTRSSNTTLSGNPGVSLSQLPSANISLGISRLRECTIERTVNSWTVSAHRVIPENSPKRRRRPVDLPRHQWFWAANHNEIATLTPDLTHTVKRHILVKRAIPIADFPVKRLESVRDVLRAKAWREQAERSDAPRIEQESAMYSVDRKEAGAWDALLDGWRRNDARMSLEQLFEFRFSIQIRVRRRYGRLHRTIVLSSNRNKAKLLEPIYRERFSVRPPFTQEFLPTSSRSLVVRQQQPPGRPRNFPSERYLRSLSSIPVEETCDLRDVLAKIKVKYDARWDELYTRDWADLVQDETQMESQMRRESKRALEPFV